MTNFTSWGHTEEPTVTEFEQQFGVKLPTDYRSFLLQNNGGNFKKQVFFVDDLKQDIMLGVLYGITNEKSIDLTIASWMEEYGDELQENALIIGADPGGGMLLYITAGEDMGIYYWDHAHFFPQSSEEEGNTYFVAPSFAAFCALLTDYKPVAP